MKFCECGCEREVTKKNNRYIIGHNSIGRIISEKTLKKMKEAKIGKIQSVETKEKISKSNLGKKHSEETKRKIGLGNKGKLLGKQFSQEHCQKLSKVKMGKKATIETKQKLSVKTKNQWKDKNFTDKIYKSRQATPNKKELQLKSILDNMYPGEWKYTGDFSFVINGKNPDFTNCNGKKLLIELFGDYWHRGENPQDRIEIFKSFGYQTLIIWEKELQDISTVENRISTFVKGVENKREHLLNLFNQINSG